MAAVTIVFLAWLPADYSALEPTGIIAFQTGLVLFAAGVICLLLHVYFRSALPAAERKSIIPVPAVRFLNFPLSILYSWVALSMEAAHSVTIRNGFALSVGKLTLTDPSSRR